MAALLQKRKGERRGRKKKLDLEKEPALVACSLLYIQCQQKSIHTLIQ